MKNILKYGAIGIIGVGVLFGRYIGRWLVYKFDQPIMTNDGRTFAKEYISGCSSINLIIKNRKDTMSHFEAHDRFNPNSDLSSKYIDKFESVFFDDGQKKYFKIIYFFPVNSWFSNMYRDYLREFDQEERKRYIIATVNNKELANFKYGNIKNPIPIVYFDAPNVTNSFYSAVSGNPEDKDFFKGTEAEFKTYQLNYNVNYYLSYVKSKADFEKMFGKQPNK